nr:MAG TPA: arginine repressor [Caudoviricetes sp.]
MDTMAKIETYHTRIDALKTSIETLKEGDRTLTIQNLPGRAPIVVHEWDDFNFLVGTIIAGDADHVYLRVPHGATYWVSSSRDITEPRQLGRNELYNHLRELAAAGEQFRIVHQPTV